MADDAIQCITRENQMNTIECLFGEIQLPTNFDEFFVVILIECAHPIIRSQKQQQQIRCHLPMQRIKYINCLYVHCFEAAFFSYCYDLCAMTNAVMLSTEVINVFIISISAPNDFHFLSPIRYYHH